MTEGIITRVNGPIITVRGLAGAGLYDVVEAGKNKLTGEIIRMSADEATVQIYEDNTGMRTGEPVWCEKRPLSLLLGPGLIGQIYDGIQRPLPALQLASGSFIKPGLRAAPLDLNRRWAFVPMAKTGDPTQPGLCLGTTRETELLEHKILLPPELSESDSITWIAPAGEYTVEDIIARTKNGKELRMAHYWPCRKPRPFSQKLSMAEPLLTGQRVIDCFFPISRGGTAAIPGGFGTGKTMTQHAVAKWCDADLIIYIGCGERGNEMTDVLREFPEITDPRTGRSIMERTILIANTSNMPVAAREISIYTGVTLAEYYRDMGLDVAIMADSTSRWAEALRELSGRLEEMPAEEGFPAYLPTRLAEFYERGGRVKTLAGQEGSISIIGAVSPPGGDFSEPVTQHTRRFIRCFWALDRELANARHYPAISWLDSYSEYVDDLKPWWEGVNALWGSTRSEAMDLLKREQRLAQIVKLIGPDALPDNERLVLLCAELVKNGFLQQSAFDQVDMYSVPEKQVRMLRMMMDFYKRSLEIIKAGAPLFKIKECHSLERLTRMKSGVANNELGKLDEIEQDMHLELDELQKGFRI